MFVGRLHETKGIIELIKAYEIYLKKVNHPKKLVIIGDGPLKNFVVEKQKSLDNNLIYKGKLPQSEISIFYKKAYCLFAPSIWLESSGLIIQEGLSYNIPVIITKRGGIQKQ